MTHPNPLFQLAMTSIQSGEYAKAELLFKELINQGNLHAKINLATLYLDPNAGFNKFAEAFLLLTEAAKEPDGIIATNNIGMMYMAGLHVEQCEDKAYTWFKIGSDKGIAACSANIGKLKLKITKEHQSQDFREAIRFFILAYYQGYHSALNDIAKALSSLNTPVAHKSFLDNEVFYVLDQFLQSSGHQTVQSNGQVEFHVAELLESIKGTQSYRALANDYYHSSNAKGYAKASNRLGEMYMNGDGVDQNQKNGFDCFKAASDLNYTNAKINLANCYIYGTGTDVDLNTAMKLLYEALEDGCSAAIPLLAFAQYFYYTDQPEIYMDKLKEACVMKDKECLYIMGSLLLEGEVIDQDEVKGMEMLQLAWDKGNCKAPINIGLHHLIKSTPESIKYAAQCFKSALDISKVPYALQAIAEIAFDYRNTGCFSEDEIMSFNKEVADLGDSQAQARVAQMYLETGMGGPESIPVAASYAIQSAANGNTLGLSIMLTFFIHKIISDKALFDKTLNGLEDAANSGDAAALFSLARLYEVGCQFLAKDTLISHEYFQRAAALECAPAKQKLKSYRMC